MKIEKEVTIYVESFIDALEIVDKMNISLPHAVIFMVEDEFDNGKCHVVIDKTVFVFYPAYKLFKEKVDTHKCCEECRYFHRATYESPCSNCDSKRCNFVAKEDDNENVSDKVIDHSNIDNLDS